MGRRGRHWFKKKNKKGEGFQGMTQDLLFAALKANLLA